jgi:membrane protease YdiL (CAAX protease family)
MQSNERSRTIAGIVLFTVLVLGAAFSAPMLGGSPAAPGPGFVLWVLAPIGSALVVRAIFRDWRDAGIRLMLRRHPGWYAISAVTYVSLMLIAIAAGSALGVLRVANFDLLPYLVGAAMAFAFFFVFAICEEMGWRGYLVPKLVSLGISGYPMHLLVALVWASWHVPFILDLSWVYNPGEGAADLIPRFYLATFAISVFFNTLRTATGSIWPAVLAHAIANAFGHLMQANYLEIAPGQERIASVGNGVIIILLFAIAGFFLSRAAEHQQRESQPG